LALLLGHVTAVGREKAAKNFDQSLNAQIGPFDIDGVNCYIIIAFIIDVQSSPVRLVLERRASAHLGALGVLSVLGVLGKRLFDKL
jgi:hypothetical protein